LNIVQVDVVLMLFYICCFWVLIQYFRMYSIKCSEVSFSFDSNESRFYLIRLG